MIINIYSKQIEENIASFKEEKSIQIDIKLTNTHLTDINKLVGFYLFRKADLYINSMTLYTAMHKVGGGNKSHHYHGLTTKEIIQALRNLKDPYAIIKTESNRYFSTNKNKKMMVFIEIGSELMSLDGNKINKIITMYPRENVEKWISKIKAEYILYRKSHY